MNQEETLRYKLDELIELKGHISSEVFQKYIVKPMRAYEKEQRNDFFSDSLKNSWRKGGRVEGVKKFFSTLEQVEVDLGNVKHELGQ